MGILFGTTNLNDPIEPTSAVSLSYPDPRWSKLKMDRNGTLDSFTTVLLRAFKYFQEKTLERAPTTWVPVVAGYPNYKIEENSRITTRANINNFDDFYFLYPFADMVTYTLKYQCAAGIHEAFGKKRMRAPQKRETLQVVEQPGIYYDVYAAPTDNLIQFDVWSSTGRGADNLAAQFKYFMEYMKGSIMKQGFQKIEFWERSIDKDITAWRDDIAVRSLSYYVRTEEMYIVPVSLISSINAEISLQYSFNDIENSFIKQMNGVPLNSGCIVPSGIPYLSGLTNTGTYDLIDNSCPC